MADFWLGYAENASRREVLMALRRVAPGSAVIFAQSAEELRERFLDEEPGTVGAIVGHTGDDVSDMNLAAALVRDGRPSEVVLVVRGASGAVRSRAQRAGVSQVVDATVAPPFGVAPEAVAERRPEGQEPRGPKSASADDRAVLADTTGGAATQAPAEVLSHQSASHALARIDRPAPYDSAALQGEAGTPCPIFTVVSGRGGVGKTSLVACLASAAADWDMSVAVVDLDLSCGNLYTCFGVIKGPDLARIAPDGAPTSEMMGRASVRCNERVHLWGPCERPEMAEVVMPHVATLLSYLSTRYDLVLVDTSTTFTDAVAQAVQSCDRLLVVHDERAGAVAFAARMSALAVRLGVARTRIVRVINLADPRTRANAFEGRAEVGLETARLYRVVDGGIEAEELLASGKVDELMSEETDLRAGVQAVLAQTLAELGCLPDCDGARKASEQRVGKRRLKLFGGKREVA